MENFKELGMSIKDITNIEISEYGNDSETRLIYFKHFNDVPKFSYNFNSIHDSIKKDIRELIDSKFNFDLIHQEESFTPENTLDEYTGQLIIDSDDRLNKTLIDQSNGIIMKTSNYDYMSFLCKKELNKETLNMLKTIISKGSNNRINTSVHMLTQGKRMDLADFRIDDKYADLDLETNYNDGFKEMHEDVLRKIDEESVGLFLFHGDPGTGKTTYLRHLIRTVNKRVIFIPPNIGASLSEPTMLNFLMDYPNSILMIEDAEKLVESRSSGNSGAVSDLLNLSDGILGDCLRFQVICTFNTNMNNLDKALLREGRLLKKYHFGSLEKDKADKLLKKLGKKERNEDLTLSEIYNDRSEDNVTEKRIGFSS